MERFIPKGAEQQNITRELELSMQLRTTCEEILQEKGKNEFSYIELFNQAFLPAGILKSLLFGLMPQDQVRERAVELKGIQDSNLRLRISCTGVNPIKAKFVDVLILDKNTPEYTHYYSKTEERKEKVEDTSWLRVRRDGRAEIAEPSKQAYVNYRVRWATTEDLSYYQKQINQSSPIEHK